MIWVESKKKSSQRGFTIVEMIVGVAIFSVMMVFSVGALLSIVAVNKQAQATKSIVNNLNYALEYMVRNIRTGSEYDCDPSTEAIDECPLGGSPGSSIALKDQNGNKIAFSLSNDSTIVKEIYDGGMNYELTAPEVIIDRLNFYIDSTDTSIQPTVLILIGGKMMVKGQRYVRFDVQTLAVQRLFNR